MHLHAALLFQLTVQTVSALRISQTKSDPRAYLEPRVEPVRPEVVEHPVIPVVVEPVHAPAPQQGNGQTDHGTDDPPLKDTAPGLSNLLPNQGSQGQHVDFGHGLANVLNDWPANIPPYAFLEPLPWEIEAGSSGDSRIPLLKPPAPISADYLRQPISDASNKRKSSPVVYTNQGSKKAKRTETKKAFKQDMLARLNRVEEIAKQGQKADQANQAKMKELEDENKQLREQLAAYEIQALASITSPPQASLIACWPLMGLINKNNCWTSVYRMEYPQMASLLAIHSVLRISIPRTTRRVTRISHIS